jgi:glycosyltransferase involved in cell wall biosynthesis
MRKREWLASAELLADQSETAAVSVIIPCYQALATIGRALASVAAQSCKPLEVIIVDDASDPETCKVLRKLADKYGADWLKIYFLRDNCGPAAARNYGWERATQPFVAFLDADDSWHKDKIALQLAFMQHYSEIDISAHSCGDILILTGRLPKRFQVLPYSLPQLIFRNRLRTPTVMLKREVVLHFPEGLRFSEDYHLWLALLKTGSRVAFLDLSLAVIHKPAFGISGQSAALWRMEIGELKALYAVWRRGSVSVALFIATLSWSLFKFLRRLLLTVFYYGRRKFPGLKI